MSDAWIQTRDGGRFDLLSPKHAKSRVEPEEVAHALSNLCRFTGHTSRFYSVAEHSVRVAARCLAMAYEKQKKPDNKYARTCALLGLVHDAAEAYTGDVSYPMKLALQTTEGDRALVREIFRDVEEYVEEKLLGYAAVDVAFTGIVKEADLQLLAWESNRFLKGGRTGEWKVLAGLEEKDLRDEIAEPLQVDSMAAWSYAWLESFDALKNGKPLPFFFGPQYAKRLLNITLKNGKKLAAFEPTALGFNELRAPGFHVLYADVAEVAFQ